MIEDTRHYSFESVEAMQDINRRVINQLIEERDSAVYARHCAEEMERSMSEIARSQQEQLEKADARIEKLKGVIDAIKLDLANEHEAHTKYRENK